MTRLLRLDEQLGARAWPVLATPASLPLAPGDTLITCAGFEDRSTEVLRLAAAAGTSGVDVVSVQYSPRLAENRESMVAALCDRMGTRPEVVQYDREDPQGAADAIFRRVRGSSRIYIDISGMSRLLVVQLVSEGLRVALGSRLSIAYTEALEYPPTRAEVDARLASDEDPLGIMMFLSAGVFGLTIVPELSSVAQQGQPLRVVAFPSWNTTQMAAVCSELQASSFTIVHGRPPLSENAWRTEAIRTLNRVEALTNPEHQHASTLDYRETLRILLNVYAEHGQQEKLVVIPTG
ncbi:MAG TPA: hypothetical protein VMO47_18710, partial [Rhodothermales bacterium]|nr:hypothetical protein [Rhodothermales bacterium]